ncbi:MAG: cold shock domain-containing protein [Desulfosalsimonadaceae bacterium]
MRYQGRITRWNNDRGFGFITPNGSRNLVFVHIKAFSDRPRRAVLNEMVFYELSIPDPNERPVAENVMFVDDGAPAAGDSLRWMIPIVLAALFLCAALVWLYTPQGSGMLRALLNWMGWAGLTWPG